MTLYRKRPVVIEAVQLTRENQQYVALKVLPKGTFVGYSTGNPVTLQIKTLEGVMTATEGDFIIRGVEGEYYPCKPDIFTKTYELVDTEEVDRLVNLAESDLVQDMDSDPVEPDVEVAIYSYPNPDTHLCNFPGCESPNCNTKMTYLGVGLNEEARSVQEISTGEPHV